MSFHRQHALESPAIFFEHFHNGFITDIKRIMKRIPADRQTLLFSATFNDDVFKFSKSLLNNPKLIEVVVDECW